MARRNFEQRPQIYERGKSSNLELQHKADFIRDYLYETKYNLTQMAIDTGLSRAAVYKFIGGGGMSIDYVEALLNTVGCRLVIEELPSDIEEEEVFINEKQSKPNPLREETKNTNAEK